MSIGLVAILSHLELQCTVKLLATYISLAPCKLKKRVNVCFGPKKFHCSEKGFFLTKSLNMPYNICFRFIRCTNCLHSV